MRYGYGSSSNCFHLPKEINDGRRPRRISQANHRLGHAHYGPSEGNVRLVGGELHDAGPVLTAQYGIRGLHARDVRLLLGPGPVPRADQVAAEVHVRDR